MDDNSDCSKAHNGSTVAFPQNKITFAFDDSVKATAGTRTQDLSFTKASLYQLSYGGA